MKPIHWLVVIILGFEMPVPLYWLVLHGPVEFWRKHVRPAFLLAVLVAWGGGDWLLYHFRQSLFEAGFSRGTPPAWILTLGLALVAADIVLFARVESTFGGRRLIGQAELSGKGEMATGGLYERVRHPRYLGMIAGVTGGCLLVGTRPLWVVGIIWLAVTLVVIRLEEHELQRRFGSAYAAYARRVPALWPFRFRSRQA